MDIASPYNSKKLLRTFLQDVTQKNKLNTALEKYLANEQTIGDLKKVSEIPFSSERKFSGCIYKDFTLILGAPEMLLLKNSKVFADVQTYTKEAYRVVAFGIVPYQFNEKNQDVRKDFMLLAIIVIEDPIREDTAITLEKLVKEHMEYRIISGDSSDTVSAIARKINKNYPASVISGEELAKLQGSDLEKAIINHNVFARIKPAQKQTIIRTLKKNKLFTIMIGDGVNDVLALKESDLGVAMNGGSTMAKDVADVVLVNNSFATLPLLLSEGRRIITNIQSIANIYLMKNIASIASILMLGFIGLRFPFSPKHVEISSFLVIGIPSFVLAFEKHNFSTTDEGFVKKLLLFSGIVGFGNAIIYTIIYTYYDLTSNILFYSRSILLTSVIFLGVNNIILIYLQHYTIYDILRRKIIVCLILIILGLFLTSISLPITKSLFEISEINPIDLLISFSLATAGSITIAYILKKINLLYVLSG